MIGAATMATFALGAMLAVFVAGSAVAASTTPTDTTSMSASTSTTESPGDNFIVINGTVAAASDHEIIASSAFPNYTNGAVDNYYSLARAHVDNSPFSEGLASPFDTGPIGQTAAAGNTQQPQYADARHPGDGKAEYGSAGGPHAVATADDYAANADASLATNKLSGPSGPTPIAVPKVFNGRLKLALSAWKAKWQGRLAPKKPSGTVTPPKPTLPKPTITTPVGTVTTPSVGGVNVPTPTPVQAPPAPSVPAPTVPSPTASAPSRSLAADTTPADGESLLSSSTEAKLVPDGTAPPKHSTTKTSTTKTKGKPEKPKKQYALVTSGESRVGRVSLGGGQIVIEGIHVTASIRNNGDGSPTYKAAVSVASASIGGVPVTIDQDGVHIAGQGQALPYQQASDALNNALKQAGIQLYLLAPEVTMCGGSASGGGGSDTTTTSTTTTPTSTDPSGGGGSSAGCGQQSSSSCDQGGSGGGTGISTPTPTTSTDTTTTPSSCDQSTTCDQLGTGGGTSTGTTTTAPTATTPTRTGTTSTTTTSSDCGSSGTTSTGGTCSTSGKGSGTSTTAGSDQSGGSSSSFGSDPFGLAGGGGASSGEETVTATGVHVVFTQPDNQSGVPSQRIEHILGEVFVDSLATPSDGSSFGFGLASGSSALSGCLGGVKGSKQTASGGGLSAGGGASAGGAAASGGSLGSSASGYSSGSQPLGATGGTTGNSLPVAFATALRKPLWLLLAYLVWQGLVIGTGWSLWNWRRGDAA